MDWIVLAKALVLGVVEGLTEFLPISSTGHLILVGDLLGFNDEKGKIFEIVIQCGAILAVCWEYRARLLEVLTRLGSDSSAQRFTLNLLIAFAPLALLGLMFGKHVKSTLFKPIPVALAFIVGGLIILWAERRQHRIRVETVDEMTWKDALKVGLAQAFALVASPRVRNQATVGGVLADADYASDPPAMFVALDARVVARSRGGEREIPAGELVTGYYETSLRPDELITEVRVPARIERAVYRKFRSRSHEDRPCVAVAAATVHGVARVVVGAVAERPQYFPELCVGPADEIGGRYAEAIEPISDVRGSADYRRRVIAVEVRRALEELAWTG